LALGSTDMRKAINGLSILVENTLEMDPFCGHLFAFCNRRRNIVKILYWVRIPVMANSDSGGSRTAVRTMANKSRSEATLFFKTSQNFSFKSI